MNDHLKGSLFIVLSMALFATQAVFVRFIGLNIFSLIAYIEILFVVSFAIYMFVKDKSLFIVKQRRWLVFFLGATFMLAQLMYLSSFRFTTLANAQISHYTGPIFAFVFAVMFLKEKFEWQSVVAIFASMTGIFLLTTGYSLDSTHAIGLLLGIASGLFYGILINISKVLIHQLHYVTFLFYQHIVVAILFIPALFMQVPTPKDFSFLIGMLIVASFIGSFLVLGGIKRVKAQHFGIIAYSEIVFATIYGFFFFKEIPASTIWLGGLLIIASGLWIIRREAKTI